MVPTVAINGQLLLILGKFPECVSAARRGLILLPTPYKKFFKPDLILFIINSLFSDSIQKDFLNIYIK